MWLEHQTSLLVLSRKSRSRQKKYLSNWEYLCLMYAPFWAGLIIVIIWAVWHLPAFLISGTPHSAWAFAPFFGGVIAMSIIMTAIFNDSRGSLLMPFLMHFQANNPIWPDAQPWDNILLIIAVIIIVWIKRQKMFKRGAGVTDILMPV